MTTYVSESSPSVLDGIGKMKSAMIEDYKLFMSPTGSVITAKMNEKYANSFEVKHGRKYIKILSNRSATAFIVGTDKDKKFKLGDILKPAGYAAPARNSARGNVLDGDYPINWTGPLYLK
jgi:hypothetical protein